MTVTFNIHAAEWEFKEELPFDIITINDTVKDFDLPLYDKDNNIKENISMKKCRVLELIGDEDSFLVVIESSLIKDQEIFDVEDNDRVFNFALHPDMPLWKEGEDIGVFYSLSNLPEILKEIKLG
jgi:hypothetical protein